MTEQLQTIELRVRDIGQLFNSFDPSPFYERDLDKDAEEFIVSWALDFARETPLRIIVHLPADLVEEARAQGVADAIQLHFEMRAEMVQKQLSEFFRIGRWSLAIGLVVLAVCLGLGALASNLVAPGIARTLAQESLLIVGWVANWRPIEIFLYEWWPIVRRRNLFRRLAGVPVDFASL